jgi:hypothetical protein
MYYKFNPIKQFGVCLLISLAFSFNACGGMEVHSDDDLQLIKEKTFKISPGRIFWLTYLQNVKVTYWNKEEVYVDFRNKNAIEKWISL